MHRVVLFGLGLGLLACNSHPATVRDAPSGDTALDAIDAPGGPAGLAMTTFSINWPTKSAVTPPLNNPWPTTVDDAYGSARTWGSVVDWVGIEPNHCNPQDLTNPCWQWSELDAFAAKTREVHFVTADYPDWSNKGAGSAAPPSDTTDTSDCAMIPQGFRDAVQLPKGDCAYQEFVFALAMHTCTGCGDVLAGPWQGHLAIRSFSPGNEVNTKQFFAPPCQAGATAGCDTLARMSADLYRIVKYFDPTVTVGTPSFTKLSGPDDIAAYLARPTTPAPGDVADVLVFHIYGIGDAKHPGMPETNWASRIADYAGRRSVTNHMAGKSIWIDEGGWGENFQTNQMGEKCAVNLDCGCEPPATPTNAPCMDADRTTNQTLTVGTDTLTNAPAPGYLVRAYLQIIASGVDRFYWYGPNSDEWGSFADYQPPAFTRTASAYAWAAMVQWLAGATLGPNTSTTTQYQVAITAKQGTYGCSTTAAAADYHGLIVWDTSAASSFDCGGFAHYCTLFETGPLGAGTQHDCVGAVTLGPNPVLLE